MVNNMRYTDDTVLIAENKEDFQQLLDIVKEKSSKKGLELNSKKTSNGSQLETTSVYRSASLSTGTNPSKKINSNSWKL